MHSESKASLGAQVPKKSGSGFDYLLRNIDKELWLKVRLKSVRSGRPVRSVIIMLLEGWTDKIKIAPLE